MSDVPVFPAERLLRAGATDEQVEAMAYAFERSDVGVQTALEKSYAGMSERGLIDHVADLAGAGYFTPTDSTSEAQRGVQAPQTANDDEPTAPEDEIAPDNEG